MCLLSICSFYFDMIIALVIANTFSANFKETASYVANLYAKQEHLGCKKGKANQKQQLSDYTYD